MKRHFYSPIDLCFWQILGLSRYPQEEIAVVDSPGQSAIVGNVLPHRKHIENMALQGCFCES